MRTPVCCPALTVSLLGLFTVIVPGRAQAQPVPNCTSQSAAQLPNLPFQVTRWYNAKAPQGGDDIRTTATDERIWQVLTVPPDRYAEINSIAVKGTHPAGVYLAIEYRTVIRGLWGDQSGNARHFLYAKQGESQPTALHIREALQAFAAPGSVVSFGVQSSKVAQLEPIVVTVTGMLRDRCKWAQ